jgi:hypothetical protein
MCVSCNLTIRLVSKQKKWSQHDLNETCWIVSTYVHIDPRNLILIVYIWTFICLSATVFTYIYIYTCHKRYSRHLIYTPCGAHLSNIWHVIRITHAWLYARPWRYNHEVEEFFVEDESTVTIRKSDLTRRTETTELEVSCPNICSVIQWLRHTTCCPPTHGSSSAHYK